MWEVIELVHSVHVIPTNDLITHAYNKNCICGPRMDLDNDNTKTVWIHDSFDRREMME